MSRRLLPAQRSRIHTIDLATGEDRVPFESGSVLFEAPNWTLDGAALIVNGDGSLFRIGLDGGSPRRIVIDGVAGLNNDHVLAPDGEHVYVSADDGHIYRAPLAGGRGERVTADDGRLHFLHGVSPDGSTLAYIGIERDSAGAWGAGSVWTIPAAGGEATELTGDRFADDGCEFSPDGRWLYFNSERAASVPGHAQLFRMRPDGRDIEQLTHDDRVNWFPHISPDGARVAYISFPPGTEGHPADRECVIRVCGAEGQNVADVVWIHGGQGSLNVPSWSPDSRSIAYVDYPRMANRAGTTTATAAMSTTAAASAP
jgi:TolB protein